MLKPVALCLAFLGLAVDAAVASQDCPIINGRYNKEVKVPEGTLILGVEHYTRVVGGVARYAFSSETKIEGDFPADGKPHDVTINGTLGKITIRCEGGAVTFSVHDGQLRLKPLDSNTLEVTADPLDDPQRNGIYRKE